MQHRNKNLRKNWKTFCEAQLLMDFEKTHERNRSAESEAFKVLISFTLSHNTQMTTILFEDATWTLDTFHVT